MKKLLFVFAVMLSQYSFSGVDPKTLPYWNLDLTKIECTGDSSFRFLLDDTQSTWIKSEDLTRLMIDMGPHIHLYPTTILGGVFVDRNGHLVFLAKTIDNTSISLVRFGYDQSSHLPGLQFMLQAEHLISLLPDLSGWENNSESHPYTCKIKK